MAYLFLLLSLLVAPLQVVTVAKKKPVTATGKPPISFGVVTAASLTAAPGRTGDGTIAVTLPTGWAAGQVALIVVYNDQGDASTPTGYTEITGSPFGAGTEKMCVFYKTLWSADADPVTTISGSTTNAAHVAAMITYNNVDTSNVIDVIGAASNGTGTPMTCNGVTTGYDSSWVVVFAGRGDNEDVNTQTINASATGVTERTDAGTSAGNDALVDIYDKAINSKGATGDASAATSITDPWVSVMVAIRRR